MIEQAFSNFRAYEAVPQSLCGGCLRKSREEEGPAMLRPRRQWLRPQARNSPGPWWTRSDGSHSNYQQVALGFFFKVSDSPHTDCLQRWCWLSPLWVLLWEQSLLGG